MQMYKTLPPEPGDEEMSLDTIHDGERQGSILDEKLPHRFGNRKRRRKLEAEIRKLNRK